MSGHLPSTGDCTIRMVSESDWTLFFHSGMSEVVTTFCASEFELLFNEDGDGAIYNQLFSPEGVTCGREPCDEGEASANPHRNLAKPAELFEPVSGVDDRALKVTFCFYTHSSSAASEGTTGSNCTVVLDLHNIGHTYEAGTPAHDGDGNGGARCAEFPAVELEGHWISQSSSAHPDSIELSHHE